MRWLTCCLASPARYEPAVALEEAEGDHVCSKASTQAEQRREPLSPFADLDSQDAILGSNKEACGHVAAHNGLAPSPSSAPQTRLRTSSLPNQPCHARRSSSSMRRPDHLRVHIPHSESFHMPSPRGSPRSAALPVLEEVQGERHAFFEHSEGGQPSLPRGSPSPSMRRMSGISTVSRMPSLKSLQDKADSLYKHNMRECGSERRSSRLSFAQGPQGPRGPHASPLPGHWSARDFYRYSSPGPTGELMGFPARCATYCLSSRSSLQALPLSASLNHMQGCRASREGSDSWHETLEAPVEATDSLGASPKEPRSLLTTRATSFSKYKSCSSSLCSRADTMRLREGSSGRLLQGHTTCTELPSFEDDPSLPLGRGITSNLSPRHGTSSCMQDEHASSLSGPGFAGPQPGSGSMYGTPQGRGVMEGQGAEEEDEEGECWSPSEKAPSRAPTGRLNVDPCMVEAHVAMAAAMAGVPHGTFSGHLRESTARFF